MAKTFSNPMAVEVIKCALQSKAIELRGPASTTKESTETAAADAAYLCKLLELLTTDQPG